MKEFIKIKLRENLVNELATKIKPKFGYGIEHDLYASEKKPNVLYKVGDKNNVTKWAEVFSSNQKLFPKIYRLGQMKDGRMYAEIEKLNTSKAKNEWDYLENKLEEFGIVDTDVFEATIDQVFINLVLGYISYNGILKKVSQDKTVVSLLKKWVPFLIKTYRYIRQFGYNGLDIHRYNFAYDSSGNIKAIDI